LGLFLIYHIIMAVPAWWYFAYGCENGKLYPDMFRERWDFLYYICVRAWSGFLNFSSSAIFRHEHRHSITKVSQDPDDDLSIDLKSAYVFAAATLYVRILRDSVTIESV